MRKRGHFVCSVKSPLGEKEAGKTQRQGWSRWGSTRENAKQFLTAAKGVSENRHRGRCCRCCCCCAVAAAAAGRGGTETRDPRVRREFRNQSARAFFFSPALKLAFMKISLSSGEEKKKITLKSVASGFEALAGKTQSGSLRLL